MHDVPVAARDLSRFRELVGHDRTDELTVVAAARAIEQLRGRAVVNVNSTASGGGVAEMLHVLLGYVRGVGIDTRWLVIDGPPEFFAITKRVHNRLYGSGGDGGPLGPDEDRLYRSVLDGEADELASGVRSGDVVVLHDPQTAGLAAAAKAHGCTVIWRCHIGSDSANRHTDAAWAFLRPHLEPHVDHYVFTDSRFPPPWVPASRLSIVWPSIDPFAPKNQDMDAATVEAILSHVGIIAGSSGPTGFRRTDGSPGRVERCCDVFRTGPSPDPGTPLVVQVSRWDRMKDMAGVMAAFARHVDSGRDAELVLAGPVVSAVADDPEGGAVLQQCWEAWRDLPHSVRTRVQLVCVPMHDLEENAAIVNALQRHASVVTQKSLAEGFGLTVAEAMLKGTPVVASAVGGIRHQILDGQTGRLVEDAADLATFGEAVCELLDDDQLRRTWGEAGRQRALDSHLGDTHLMAWLDVLDRLEG